MALVEGMFLFEVVVESVKSLIESKQFVIKSDFADIFSLELRDPKHLNIVMPEPPPLPPEPPGKKGKKPKPKPKPKGKKGAIVEEPTGPLIQSGQSVLFACSAEFLIQNMRKCPIEISLWDKDERLTYIGSNSIPWDETYLAYLSKIANCQDPPPVVVKDEYNIFEEGTAKLVAKLGIQIKLSFLKDKVSAAFRTLSEDSNNRKYLYTGLNSKTTSYICSLKTDEDTFIKNSNKIQNNFTEDKSTAKAIQYANFTNAPGANLTFFEDGTYCCIKNANKPPESIYKAPETYPSIDEITDYVRKIIVSCNDNMRMLTPHPKIKPRVKASDIEKLCHCTQTGWPESNLAQRVKQDVLNDTCLICSDTTNTRKESRNATIDLANIRGPCGNPNCKISRDLRSYIETLVEEDKREVNINEIVGPCGSKSCSVADKIQKFLRHDGAFNKISTLEGLSTQCGCIQTMKTALLEKKKSCQSVCDKECMSSDDADGIDNCRGSECPVISQMYNVYYCTVDNKFDTKSLPSSKQSSQPVSQKSSNLQFCATDCPSAKSSHISCSKNVCNTLPSDVVENTKCEEIKISLSPNDSEILIHFDDIRNPCCVKTCDVVDKLKDFIVDSWEHKQTKDNSCVNDPCYCDCECHFNSSKKTTYCAVCGGYEVHGTDLENQPLYAKPHPCPIYHKLYDKRKIKVESAWIEDEEQKSGKSSMVINQKAMKQPQKVQVEKKIHTTSYDDVTSQKKLPEKNDQKRFKEEVRRLSVPSKVTEKTEGLPLEKSTAQKYIVPFVPKNMGWLWNAEDVPGLQYRPQWKPGASLKGLVRRYRAMRGSIDIMAKKKRAMLQKRKKLEMKPTLVIKKIDGEYEVQMEVFKKYSKDRLLYQYPYEEKPPLIYTIGKTDEELEKVLIKREKRERRETRRKCKILQSTFRDRCQEICLKAYNQAIGVLPISDPNNPPCPCDVDKQNIGSPQIDSCSCSDGDISSSDTDGDDWVIEFSPPAARWNAKAKHLPAVMDSDSQYTYLDYRVKLLDKSGNPVSRFFKGPDGKQECSDLGGFWGPDHVWMDINKDGYIGVDNRWVPMNFIGPDGMFYSSKEGTFTDNNGHFLKIGIDGYIDKDGKWAWYPKRRESRMKVGSNTYSKLLKKVPTNQSVKRKEKDGLSKTPKDPPVKTKPKNTKSVTIKPFGKETKAPKSVSYKQPKSKSTIVMSMTPILSRYNSPLKLTETKFQKTSLLQSSRRWGNKNRDYDTYNFFPDERVKKSTRACNTKKFTPFTMIQT